MNNKTKRILLWLLYYIKKLFPCLYYSYGTVMKDKQTEEYKVVQVWRMWFGKILWEKKWKVI